MMTRREAHLLAGVFGLLLLFGVISQTFFSSEREKIPPPAQPKKLLLSEFYFSNEVLLRFYWEEFHYEVNSNNKVEEFLLRLKPDAAKDFSVKNSSSRRILIGYRVLPAENNKPANKMAPAYAETVIRLVPGEEKQLKLPGNRNAFTLRIFPTN